MSGCSDPGGGSPAAPPIFQKVVMVSAAHATRARSRTTERTLVGRGYRGLLHCMYRWFVASNVVTIKPEFAERNRLERRVVESERETVPVDVVPAS